MTRLNKKVLCFVDESGTPGRADFMLGAVAVHARDVSVAESLLLAQRPVGAGEIHATDVEGIVARRLLQELKDATADRRMVLLNKRGAHHPGSQHEVYVAATVEIVKVAIKRFASLHRIREIGNVELILDRNGINSSIECQLAFEKARRDDGRFRAVAHIAAVDSGAARFLQVADLVAYARRWCDQGEIDARRLRDACGVELL